MCISASAVVHSAREASSLVLGVANSLRAKCALSANLTNSLELMGSVTHETFTVSAIKTGDASNATKATSWTVLLSASSSSLAASIAMESAHPALLPSDSSAGSVSSRAASSTVPRDASAVTQDFSSMGTSAVWLIAFKYPISSARSVSRDTCQTKMEGVL